MVSSCFPTTINVGLLGLHIQHTCQISLKRTLHITRQIHTNNAIFKADKFLNRQRLRSTSLSEENSSTKKTQPSRQTMEVFHLFDIEHLKHKCLKISFVVVPTNPDKCLVTDKTHSTHHVNKATLDNCRIICPSFVVTI